MKFAVYSVPRTSEVAPLLSCPECGEKLEIDTNEHIATCLACSWWTESWTTHESVETTQGMDSPTELAEAKKTTEAETVMEMILTCPERRATSTGYRARNHSKTVNSEEVVSGNDECSSTNPPVSNRNLRRWRKQFGSFIAQEIGTKFDRNTVQYAPRNTEKTLPNRQAITEDDVLVARQAFGLKVLDLCLSFSSLPKEEQERLERMAAEYDPMTGEYDPLTDEIIG